MPYRPHHVNRLVWTIITKETNGKIRFYPSLSSMSEPLLTHQQAVVLYVITRNGPQVKKIN